MKYFSMFSGIGGFELGIDKAFQRETAIQSERQMDVLQPTGHITDSDSIVGVRRGTRPICVGYSEIDKYAIKVYERHFNGHTNYDEISNCAIIGVCSNQFVTNVELENLCQKAKAITGFGVLSVGEKLIVSTPENDTKEILRSLENIVENTGETTQKQGRTIRENIPRCYENGCSICTEISVSVATSQKKSFSALTISKMMEKLTEKNTGTALLLLCSTSQKTTNQKDTKYYVITAITQKQGEVYVHTARTVNFGNATKINPTELPDFDLLVGGFPCQAFSIAGKRAGFNDTRGTLFFDIARILKEKRPRHLVLENVKGLLSHDSGRTFTTIIGVLTDLGYLVEWQVLNSKDFGVPQNRERVYIVGHLGNECRRKVFPITGSSQQIATVAGYISEEVWPRRHEQIRRVYKTDGAMPTIPTGQGGGVMTKFIAAQRGRGNPPAQTLEPQIEDKTNTLTAVAKDNYVVDVPRIRRLTPLECERLQGFPDDWTAGESDTQRYKMCGNAVTVNVVEAVMRSLYSSCGEGA